MKLRYKSTLTVLLIAALATLAAEQPAVAIPYFSKTFQEKYVKPDSDDATIKKFAELATASSTGKCFICHVKGEKKTVRNAYGMALAELLNKDDFKKARLDNESDKAKEEVIAALDKVASQTSNPRDEDSATFGDLIAQAQLPGAPQPTEKEEPDTEEASDEDSQPDEPGDESDGAGQGQEEVITTAAGTTGDLAVRLFSQLQAEVKEELKTSLKAELSEQLKKEIRAELKAELKDQLKDSLKPVLMAELSAVRDIDPEQEAEAIKQVQDLGGTVLQIAQNDDSRRVAFHLSGKELTDAGLRHLQSVGKIAELNLKDTNVTDQGMSHLSNLVTLERLNLARTQVSDDGLAHLRGLDNVYYLNLYGSQVTDDGLEHLKGLTNLRKLYLWQSKVTADGVERLREELPQCEINF